MNNSAFVSTFLPPLRQLSPGSSLVPIPPSKIHSYSWQCNLLNSHSEPLRRAAIAITSLSFVLQRHPTLAEVDFTSCKQCESTQYTLNKHTSSSPSSAILVKRTEDPPESSDRFAVTPSQDDNSVPSTGALLILEPAVSENPLVAIGDDGDIVNPPFVSLPEARSHNATKVPPRVGASKLLPEWATTKIQRQVHSERLIRMPTRIRPATVGLVGVGAFTSGSAVLRSIVQKASVHAEEKPVSGTSGSFIDSHGFCTVACVHIPFCVPDRPMLLRELSRLEETVDLSTEEGIAKAARETAAVFLEEAGLLEDSRTFAPTLDVFLADSITSAERRFSGHVLIEGNRLEKMSQSCDNSDILTNSQTGQYGIVTLVVATTDGVNLKCFEEGTTVMKRLRATLDQLSQVKSGDVAGLELVWIPDSRESRSLSKTQLAEAFPNLNLG